MIPGSVSRVTRDTRADPGADSGARSSVAVVAMIPGNRLSRVGVGWARGRAPLGGARRLLMAVAAGVGRGGVGGIPRDAAAAAAACVCVGRGWGGWAGAGGEAARGGGDQGRQGGRPQGERSPGSVSRRLRVIDPGPSTRIRAAVIGSDPSRELIRDRKLEGGQGGRPQSESVSGGPAAQRVAGSDPRSELTARIEAAEEDARKASGRRLREPPAPSH